MSDRVPVDHVGIIRELNNKLKAADAEQLNLAGHIENFRKRNVELACELILERKISAMLLEYLKDVIRNSHDIVAKKHCSRALELEKEMRIK